MHAHSLHRGLPPAEIVWYFVIFCLNTTLLKVRIDRRSADRFQSLQLSRRAYIESLQATPNYHSINHVQTQEHRTQQVVVQQHRIQTSCRRRQTMLQRYPLLSLSIPTRCQGEMCPSHPHPTEGRIV